MRDNACVNKPKKKYVPDQVLTSIADVINQIERQLEKEGVSSSQTAIGKIVDLDQTTVGRLQREEISNPKLSALLGIAKGAGMTVDQVIGLKSRAKLKLVTLPGQSPDALPEKLDTYWERLPLPCRAGIWAMLNTAMKCEMERRRKNPPPYDGKERRVCGRCG